MSNGTWTFLPYFCRYVPLYMYTRRMRRQAELTFSSSCACYSLPAARRDLCRGNCHPSSALNTSRRLQQTSDVISPGFLWFCLVHTSPSWHLLTGDCTYHDCGDELSGKPHNTGRAAMLRFSSAKNLHRLWLSRCPRQFVFCSVG